MRCVLLLICIVSVTALAGPGCAPTGGGGGGSGAGDGLANNVDADSVANDNNSIGGPGAAAADADGDGVPDLEDAFPDDPAESTDTDGDGLGDNADPDDDGDGVPDVNDPAPTDDTVSTLAAPINPYAGQPGQPVPGLTADVSQQFASGQDIFQKRFVAGEGLGQFATVSSCMLCHGIDTPAAAGGLHDFIFSDTVAQRNVAALYGLGLLEGVSDDEILSRQDPFDLDDDGISGRPNLDGSRIGRFGRKAQAATLESIVRGMALIQLGLTTDATSQEGTLRPAQIAPPPDNGGQDGGDGDLIPDPEIAPEALRDLLAYTLNLAAPLRGPIDLAVDRGQDVFEATGCEKCHTATLTSDDNLPIYPYSDLLLHDMGDALADGIEPGLADGAEFRTQPLWGLGVATPYLHDGRAQTIEQAIAQHGGEAQAARDAFEALDSDALSDLLAFLESL